MHLSFVSLLLSTCLIDHLECLSLSMSILFFNDINIAKNGKYKTPIYVILMIHGYDIVFLIFILYITTSVYSLTVHTSSDIIRSICSSMTICMISLISLNDLWLYIYTLRLCVILLIWIYNCLIVMKFWWNCF